MGARFNFEGLIGEIKGLLMGHGPVNATSDLLEKTIIHEEL